jgi:hypothetical protein
MNMVFHAVDTEQRSFSVFDNTVEVFVEFGRMLLMNG